MRLLALALKGLAMPIGCVAMLHLALGLEADAVLGIEAASSVATDPGLSSQNRFFGVAYALYAAVFWLAATDLPRYRPVLLAALALTFVAGVSRFVPWVVFGAPPVPIVCLLLVELVGPALLLVLLRRAEAGPHSLVRERMRNSERSSPPDRRESPQRSPGEQT